MILCLASLGMKHNVGIGDNVRVISTSSPSPHALQLDGVHVQGQLLPGATWTHQHVQLRPPLELGGGGGGEEVGVNGDVVVGGYIVRLWICESCQQLVLHVDDHVDLFELVLLEVSTLRKR